MPAQQTLKMQCLGLADFEALIDQNAFQPPSTPASSESHTTALLLIFHAEVDLKDVGHINISLIMCCQVCNFYEQDAILGYMGSIRADLVAMKRKYEAVGCKLPVWSYTLLVGNFGGRIAVPTNPPYCLIHTNTYLSTVLLLEQTPFNTMGSPPGLHLGKCMCCALLQVADLSTERKQQYAGSHFTNLPTDSLPSLSLTTTACHSEMPRECPNPWKQWGTSPMRTKSSHAFQGTACFLMVLNSQGSSKRITAS